jgi:hypothetical protein
VRLPSRSFQTSAARAVSGPWVQSRDGSVGSSAATTARRAPLSRDLSSSLATPASAAFTPMTFRVAEGTATRLSSICGIPASTSRAVVGVTPVSRANSSAASGCQGAGPRSASSARKAATQPGARVGSGTNGSSDTGV